MAKIFGVRCVHQSVAERCEFAHIQARRQGIECLSVVHFGTVRKFANTSVEYVLAFRYECVEHVVYPRKL